MGHYDILNQKNLKIASEMMLKPDKCAVVLFSFFGFRLKDVQLQSEEQSQSSSNRVAEL